MKSLHYLLFSFLVLFAFQFVGAQEVKKNPDAVYKDQAPVQREDRVYDDRDVYRDGNDRYPRDERVYNRRAPRSRDVDESLNRAAEAASRAAEKLQVVIEEKAHRIARESQPLIENFLIATSDLIEKLATEISRAVDDRPRRQ